LQIFTLKNIRICLVDAVCFINLILRSKTSRLVINEQSFNEISRKINKSQGFDISKYYRNETLFEQAFPRISVL
jgi:hypothetical protein